MDVVARVREIAGPLARAEGVEVLDITFAREGRDRVLRLTIERDGAPTSVGDCATISRAVGNAVDAENVIEDQYRLEVSSAGLTRRLKILPDFARSVGSMVRIELGKGRKGPVVGRLAAADETGLKIVLDDGTERRLELAEIASARREVDFGGSARKGRRAQ